MDLRKQAVEKTHSVYQLGIVVLTGCVLLLQGCQHGMQTSDLQADSAIIDQTKSLLPLSNDLMQTDHWIDPEDPGYNQSVLTKEAQSAHFDQLKRTYYGDDQHDPSPWNGDFIAQKLIQFGQNSRQTIADIEQHYLNKITHPDSLIFGENFRQRSNRWKYALAANTDIDQFRKNQSYKASHRAIALRRSDVRTLPSSDPVFENPREAGQGYPFDTLQNSSLAPATPVYILGQTKDQQWYLILAPEVLGWVKAVDIGKVNAGFVAEWRSLADQQLGTVIDHQVPVRSQYGQVLMNADIATLLPIAEKTDSQYTVYLPVVNQDGQAQIQKGSVDRSAMRDMPWQASPKHFAVLMQHMVGRPYGWGGMLGDNDCSAELRQLMMPFGLFLPRNSFDQSHAGARSDQSHLSVSERIDYLMHHGKPFRTIVYIGGHVMLYIGNRDYHGSTVPMTYQNIWGLRPADNSRRAIIGQSLFFPLLTQYAEDSSLQSLADKKWFVLTDIGAADSD